jgi:GNAT superfamily N-acetyltransferase
MDDWRIERLSQSHQRDGFACGKAPLDDFLRTLAGQYDKRNIGRTFVAVRDGHRRVLGYYTLASSALEYEHVPARASEKLPRHPVPVILIARLAVDQTVRGQGLGERLLVDALRRSLDIAESAGVYAIEVDALGLDAKLFYEKYGFAPLVDSDLHLYMSIKTVRAVFAKQ